MNDGDRARRAVRAWGRPLGGFPVASFWGSELSSTKATSGSVDQVRAACLPTSRMYAPTMTYRSRASAPIVPRSSINIATHRMPLIVMLTTLTTVKTPLLGTAFGSARTNTWGRAYYRWTVFPGRFSQPQQSDGTCASTWGGCAIYSIIKIRAVIKDRKHLR